MIELLPIYINVTIYSNKLQKGINNTKKLKKLFTINTHFVSSLLLNSQKDHFQILILRSTLHLALEVEAVVAAFPVGTVALIPSHETLTATFGVFKTPILAFTFVSRFNFNETPLLLFNSVFNFDAAESSSASEVPEIAAFSRVVFFAGCAKDGSDPPPTLMSSAVVTTTVMGS